MKEEGKVLLAKKVLRNRDVGVLSTLHGVEGELFPYGSICPFISTSESKLVILISSIALHTKNILENERVGFTVFDMEAKNKQAASRVSLMGKAWKVDPKKRSDYKEIKERYLTFFPEAKRYFEAHDFNFYEITPDKVHFIETFGKIFTFTGSGFINEAAFSEMEEKEAVSHMNQDHKSFLVKLASTLELQSGIKHEDEVRVLRINREGFFLWLRGQINYVSFKNSVNSFGELRTAFKDLI